MERSTTHSEDIGFLKGISESVEKGVVRLEKKFDDKVVRLEDKIDKFNDEHTKFHAHMSSKFDGWTAQHYQKIEQWRKEDREFEAREINLLKKEVDSVKRKVGSKNAKWSVIKHGITSIASVLATWLTLNNK